MPRLRASLPLLASVLLLPACNITGQSAAMDSRLPAELPWEWSLRLEFSYHAFDSRHQR